MSLLEVASVSKHFNGREVLSGVEFSVEEGEIVSVLGASGSGKSTLLNLVSGLLMPDTGAIRMNDAVISDPRTVVPPQHRGMNMVFQEYALWPHMTVFENVAYGLRRMKVPGGELRQRVKSLLTMVALEGFEQRYPAQLSGGQRQRIAIARALATQPRLVLMDEPLSNLDAELRQQMRGELGVLLRKANVTVLNVTHDAAEALALSDRVLVLDGGRVLQYAKPEEIYRHPACPRVARVVGAANVLPVQPVSLEGDYAEVHAGNLRLRGRISAATSAAESTVENPVAVLRPEAATVIPATNRTEAAEVRHCAFEGREYRLLVDLDGAVVALFSNQPYAVGSLVAIDVAPDNLLLYGIDTTGKVNRQNDRFMAMDG